MMGRQLAIVAWVRWRIAVHRFHRAGSWVSVVGAILAAIVVATMIVGFALGLILGWIMLPEATPRSIGLTWSVLFGGCLLLWTIGFISDLQRDELLPLNKLLHLPISSRDLFLLNYLTAYLSASLVLFLPGMLGLTMAHVFRQGARMLWLFPLLASSIFLLTAVSYYLRGWLAQFMEDKRTRRRLMASITFGVILLSQLPQLVNLLWTRSLVTRQVTSWNPEIDESWLKIGSRFFPPAWLPWGAYELAKGESMSAWWGIGGGFLIGAWCLQRAYRATLAGYLGVSNDRSRRRQSVGEGEKRKAGLRSNWLAKRLPWVSEPSQAVCWLTLRNLSRSPEAKLAILIGLIVMLPLFGLAMMKNPPSLPKFAQPAVHMMAVLILFYTQAQLALNQFGWDRQGFRVLVLCPASRMDVLWGKNLAGFIIMILSGWFLTLFLLFFLPLDWLDSLSVLLLTVSAASMTLSWANIPTIFIPMPTSTSAWRKTKPNLKTVLGQFLALLLFPVFLSPVVGIGALALLLRHTEVVTWPVLFPLSLLGMFLTAFFYRWMLRRQSVWLERQQLRILEEVCQKVE